ncbi:MAG: hypothetical protein JRF33_14780 [Deltaproteobacteria bacterium]|nr:hypothetical protein [Deltaproteobacteria bacterium]
MTTCTLHRNARAAWRCNKCQSFLCPSCAAPDERFGSKLVRCVQCGGLAELLMEKKEIKSYWGMLPAFYKGMFSVSGLTQLAVLGGFLAILAWVGRMPLLGGITMFLNIAVLFVYVAVFASYYFLIVRQASLGEETLPERDNFAEIGEVLLTGIRFVLAVAFLWVPVLIYLWNTNMQYAEVMDFLKDPFLVIILLVSFLYVPGAIITTAISESMFAMLNPANVILIAFRVPRDYIVTAVVWGLLHVIQVLFKGLLGVTLLRIEVPLLIPFVYEVLTLVLPLTGAFVLGWMIYQNEEAFGLLGSKDMMVPELPNAMPTGVMPVAELVTDEPSQAPVEPIELDESVSEAAGEEAQASLRQAVEAGDGQSAQVLLARLKAKGLPSGMDAQAELTLAAVLGRSGLVMEAAQLCREVAEREPEGPFAARAIFTAARLATEQLGRKDQGVALYRYLVEKYPRDPYAERARGILTKLGA